MPRQPRLDAPGLLQHVMARGIERRNIFMDDTDRRSFLDRLAVILDETQTQCYAWSLMSNHFHLLLRTTQAPLPTVMRRLMTGHAVTFNKRHRRAGHLFQNRYKSVVCEEDNYLLELTRYIHLNPLRARLVKDLRELDKYPWAGHSAILGKCDNPLIPEITPSEPEEEVTPDAVLSAPCSLAEKTLEDVLLYFGKDLKAARKEYREFVKEGISKGRREDLRGGGLIRSAGGSIFGLHGLHNEERELSDDRILGSGDFVASVIRVKAELDEKRRNRNIPVSKLLTRVAQHCAVAEDDILSNSRRREIGRARAIISYLAIRELMYPATDVAKVLNISAPSVSRCIERGKALLGKDASASKLIN